LIIAKFDFVSNKKSRIYIWLVNHKSLIGKTARCVFFYYVETESSKEIDRTASTMP